MSLKLPKISQFLSIAALVLSITVSVAHADDSQLGSQNKDEQAVLFQLNMSWQEEAHAVILNSGIGPEGVGAALYNRNTSQLMFSFFYTNLTELPTASHFHSGSEGEDGGVVQTICGQPGPGLLASCPQDSETGEIMGVWQVPPDQVQDLMAGKLYINVHTTKNPSGELRGQLISSAD